MLAVSRGDEQVPYEVSNPALTENFRQIYFQMDKLSLSPFFEADGAAIGPSFSFTSSTDTGMYLVSAGRIGFSTNGIIRMAIGTASVDFSVDASPNVSLANNLGDSGHLWGKLFVGGIVGTTTNDDATAGNYGQFFSSIPAQGVNAPTTSQFGDVISSAVTSGDWDITYCVHESAAGATVTRFQVAISSVSGNSSTNLLAGINLFDAPIPANGVRGSSFCVPNYRVTVAAASTQLWYMKIESDFTVATPTISGWMHMRRAR